MLNINEYQNKAMTFMNPDAMELPESMLLNALLGLAGETGETCDIVKKHLWHGHNFNKDHLINEAGDIMFYLALLASALDTSLSEICNRNVAKLDKRYPNGFTVADSKLKRDQNEVG